MTKRRILLSGGTGFIGQRLTTHLVAAGYHISALCRNDRSDSSPSITWIPVGDLSATSIDPAIGRGIDVFVNLAATLRPTSSDPSGLQSQTAAIARNLSRFIADANVPRVLVLSSIAASVAASDPAHARRYGFEKLSADRIFLEQSGNGRHVVVLRPPAVYAQDMQNSIGALAGMVRKGLPIPLGSATEPRQYISMHNLCDVIETIVGADDHLWAEASGRAFEPSDGQAIATRDLVRMIGEAMGRRARMIPIPTVLLRTLGALTGRSELISGAIDRLDVAPVSELDAAFGWRSIEQMPESLAFLRDDDIRL